MHTDPYVWHHHPVNQFMHSLQSQFPVICVTKWHTLSSTKATAPATFQHFNKDHPDLIQKGDLEYVNILYYIEALHKDQSSTANPNGPTIKPVDIGYFNPSYKTAKTPNIIDDSKTSTYIDVFTFTDKLKYIASTTPNDEDQNIRDRLPIIQARARQRGTITPDTTTKVDADAANPCHLAAADLDRYQPKYTEQDYNGPIYEDDVEQFDLSF
ncbi:hypothetical protein QBC39DRAFT_326853 [Podospora conica]|nr:hypothetical protein QBC39DRAFT_326853 [Schizothecium conicum]